MQSKFDKLIEDAAKKGIEIRLVAFTEPLGDEPRIPHYLSKMDDGGDLSFAKQHELMRGFIDSPESDPKKPSFSERFLEEMKEINSDINLNMAEFYSATSDILDLYHVFKEQSQLQEAEYLAVYGRKDIPEGHEYVSENFQKIRRVHKYMDTILYRGGFENPMQRMMDRDKAEAEKENDVS